MSKFDIDFSKLAEEQLLILINDPSKKAVAKSVIKSLKYMHSDLRHPSLHTHKYNDMVGPRGEEIFESYAQNKTPGACRIFWFYGPEKSVITILAITAHP